MSKHTYGAIIDSCWMFLEEKSLDKISVKDIIETAQINRNTFYYNHRLIHLQNGSCKFDYFSTSISDNKNKT